MSMYRCAACGSTKVVTDTKKDGIEFNYVKGAIGTVALGAGGAVAGLSNKTVQVYKCADCGTELTYSMPLDIKVMIDMGVMSASARDNLQLNGLPISWETLKQRFKNIESGFADEEIQRNEANEQAYVNELDRQFAEIAKKYENKDEYIKLGLLFDDLCLGDVSELQKEWEIETQEIKAKYEAELNECLEDLEKSKNSNIEKENRKTKREIASLEEKISSLKKENSSLQVELSSLGFFKIGRKKQIESQIENNLNTISSLNYGISQEKQRLSAKTDKINKDFLKEKENAEEEIKGKYPIKQNPAEKKAALLKKKAAFENLYKKAETSNQDQMNQIKGAIVFLLNEIYPTSLTKEEIHRFIAKYVKEDVTPGRVSILVRQLVWTDKLIQKDFDDGTYYCEIR